MSGRAGVAMHVTYKASAGGGPTHVTYKASDGQQGESGVGAQAGRSGGCWAGGQRVRDRAAALNGHARGDST